MLEYYDISAFFPSDSFFCLEAIRKKWNQRKIGMIIQAISEVGVNESHCYKIESQVFNRILDIGHLIS